MSKILAQGMITLTQLYEGAQVILSPTAVLIPCDSEENPKPNAYINASTNVKVFLGTMDITSGITLGELEYSDSTVKASKTETKVSITAITTRTGYVDIPVSATINGETIDLGKHRFNFVKQIDGQPGIPGDPGFGYTLNIKGGTRGVAYAANGTNPEPNTSSQFSVELLKNGVKVANPASISWTCGGNLSGASSVATFTPTIKSTYTSGSSYVKVSVKEFAASLAVEETIPIICTKHADGLDWINEWNGKYVQVGTEKIITPKIFAGTKSSANELTGVAIGRDVLGGNTNKVIGIVGYKKNTPVFSLDQDANFFVSSSGNAGDIKNGTNNAKGLYFDGNNLYISGKVKISGGSTIGESNTLVEDVINNSNLGAQANNKLDNLSIGGRNYCTAVALANLKSADNENPMTFNNAHEHCPNGFYAVGNKNSLGIIRLSNVINSNGYWTVSFDLRSSQNISVGMNVDICGLGTTTVKTTDNNSWKRVSVTVNVNNYSKDEYNYVDFSQLAWAYFFVRNIKVEQGNKATDFTPAPEDIQANIDNIQIGGRNLIGDSNLGGFTSNAYGFGVRKVIGGLKNNTTYTFSVNGRSNPNGNTEGKSLMCYIYEKSWNHGSWQLGIGETTDTTRSFTFTTGNTIEGKNVEVAFYWYPSGGDRTGNATVNWCKLEQGNKATDWTPAPEDVDTAINNAIDNIQVGGRNLAQGTSETFKTLTGFTGITNHCGLNHKVLLKGLSVGDSITTSFVFMCENLTNNNPNRYVRIQGSGDVTGWGNGLYQHYDVPIDYSKPTQQLNIIHTFTITENHLKNEYWTIGLRLDYITGGTVGIKELMVEKGNKKSTWTPSPEDVDAEISAVNNKAQDSINKLTELASDSKLTAGEKLVVKREWDVIVGEKTKITSEADKFGVSKTDYESKYNTLNSYITPLLSNLTTTSDINGSTFRSNFTNYYNSRQDLLNAITTKAKTLADNAQSTANTANNTANTVNTTVNNNKNNWSNAYERVKQWASGAITGSTTINGGMIEANTIVAEKIAIGDFTNYAQLNETTASKLGFIKESNEAGGAWLRKNGMARDIFISDTHTCNGGESFRIKFDISTTIKGNSSSGGTDSTYRGTAIGLYCYNGTGASVGIAYSTRYSNTTVNGSSSYVTIPASTRKFRVFIQTESYGNFSGDLKVRNIQVTKMASGELIVDGSIKTSMIHSDGLNASVIKAGTISADRLDANTIVSKVNGGTTEINGNRIQTGTLSASKITTGTLDATKVSVTNLNADNIKSGTINSDRLNVGTLVSKINNGSTTISGNKITTGTISADKLKIQSRDSFSVNPNFANWTSTYPYGTSSWSDGGISKVTVDNRYVAQFNVSNASSQQGMYLNNSFFNTGLNLDGMQYIGLEVKYRLTSGTNPAGACMLLDIFYTDGSYDRLNLSLKSINPTVTTNTWYTAKRVFKVSNIQKTFKSVSGYLLANWSSETNTAKTIQFASANAYACTEQDYLTQTWTSGTEINGASIKTGTLSADKITTGTLDANKVNVTNIKAGNIVSGTIDASKISVTNLNASNITSGTLRGGGYNLLRNSGFKNEKNYWSVQKHNNPTEGIFELISSSATWGYPDASVKTAQIRLSNQSNIEYGIAQNFNTTIGKQYTLTFQYAGHRISGANVIIRGANGSWLANKYFTPTSFNGGNGNVNQWGTCSLTFTATTTSHTLNIVINTAQNDGYLWVAKPQIVEGAITLPYSPHPDETYAGIVKLDSTGINVSHSNANTTTQMNSQGFFIYNSQGETVGSLATETGLSVVNANKVYADNIRNIYEGAGTLYVDHNYTGASDGSSSKPFKSFADLRTYLEATPIINTNVTVNIVSTSEITEPLVLDGLYGNGWIEFKYAKTCIHRTNNSHMWCINLKNIYKPLWITGQRSSYNTSDGAILCDNGNQHGIRLENCSWVDIRALAINCKNWGIFVINSRGQSKNIDFCKTYCAFEFSSESHWYDSDACGNCSDFFRLYSGSMFIYGSNAGGYRPFGNKLEYSGRFLLVGAERTQTNSFRTPPPAPTTSDQYGTWSMKDYGYFTYGRNGVNVNSWNPASKRIQQGEWSGYGNNYGFAFFDDAGIRSWLSNGTPKDGSTITLKRASSGGYSSSQPVYLCGATNTSCSGTPSGVKSYGNIGSLAWGESKTFNLPTQFVKDLKSGTIKSACFYDSSGASYVKLDSVSIKLKANKPV